MSVTSLYVPFALSQRPAGDDPQRHHEDEKDGARTYGHQRLEDESRVKVDAVEGTDRPRRSVRKQFTIERNGQRERERKRLFIASGIDSHRPLKCNDTARRLVLNDA